MSELGKLLILFGTLIVVVGLILVFGSRLHLPIGRLPGDIVYRGKNTTVYFPIVTSIVISIVLSLIFYLISRLSR
jgi:formate hydrogenlyase subunit 3/multisubunit Na+/H+ antiporter MnhD subunit